MALLAHVDNAEDIVHIGIGIAAQVHAPLLELSQSDKLSAHDVVLQLNIIYHPHPVLLNLVEQVRVLADLFLEVSPHPGVLVPVILEAKTVSN